MRSAKSDWRPSTRPPAWTGTTITLQPRGLRGKNLFPKFASRTPRGQWVKKKILLKSNCPARNFIGSQAMGYVKPGLVSQVSCVLIKGLRLFLKEFVVTMHEGTCEQVQSIGHNVEGLDVLIAQAQVHCDNKTQQIGPNQDYNMTFSISSREYQYSPLKMRIWCLKQEQFHMLVPLLSPMLPLTTGIVTSQCLSSRETMLVTCCLTTTKHLHNESVDLTSNHCWNFP